MLHRLRRRLTYANVMSTLAVFFAFAGGTAVALDGSNTVFGDDIVDNQVSSADVRDDNLGFGGLAAKDLGPNSVGSSEIANGSVNGFDVENGSVQGIDITDDSLTGDDIDAGSVLGGDIGDGTLNDEDVGQGTFVNFAADIGLVPANTCVYKDITGINAQGDHLLLTPSNNDSFLIYGIQYRSGQEFARLQVCNPFSFTANDEITHFNLLVIDAQWRPGQARSQGGGDGCCSVQKPAAATVRPRLEAANADLSRVHTVQVAGMRRGRPRPSRRCARAWGPGFRALSIASKQRFGGQPLGEVGKGKRPRWRFPQSTSSATPTPPDPQAARHASETTPPTERSRRACCRSAERRAGTRGRIVTAGLLRRPHGFEGLGLLPVDLDPHRATPPKPAELPVGRHLNPNVAGPSAASCLIRTITHSSASMNSSGSAQYSTKKERHSKKNSRTPSCP